MPDSRPAFPWLYIRVSLGLTDVSDAAHLGTLLLTYVFESPGKQFECRNNIRQIRAKLRFGTSKETRCPWDNLFAQAVHMSAICAGLCSKSRPARPASHAWTTHGTCPSSGQRWRDTLLVML